MKEDALVDAPVVVDLIGVEHVVTDLDTNAFLLLDLVDHLQHVFHDVLRAFINAGHFKPKALAHDVFAQARRVQDLVQHASATVDIGGVHLNLGNYFT